MNPEKNNTPPEGQDTGAQAAPEGQDTAPRKYAGKYGSVEELEKGYQNLQSLHGQTANEIGGLKGQLKQMQETIAAGQQQQAQQPVDYDQMHRQVVTDFQQGKIDEVGMAEQLADIKTSKLDQQYQQVLAQQEEKFSGMLQQELGKRDQQDAYKTFTTQNPDFESLVEDGTLEQVIRDNPFVRDEYEAYHALKANSAQSSLEQAKQEAFEAGKAETLKQIGGSQPAQEVSGGAGQAVAAPAASATAGGTPGRAELFQSGLEAFRNAGA